MLASFDSILAFAVCLAFFQTAAASVFMLPTCGWCGAPSLPLMFWLASLLLNLYIYIALVLLHLLLFSSFST
jgi:hypothetical protein